MSQSADRTTSSNSPCENAPRTRRRRTGTRIGVKVGVELTEFASGGWHLVQDSPRVSGNVIHWHECTSTVVCVCFPAETVDPTPVERPVAILDGMGHPSQLALDAAIPSVFVHAVDRRIPDGIGVLDLRLLS